MPIKDKVKRKEYLKKYYLEHAGKDVPRRNFGHHLSKEEIAQYKHVYYLTNRTRINAYKNRWQKNWRKINSNRLKENKRQVGRKRRLDHCEICNSKEQLQYHHWNYEKNLGCTLCRSCHQIQHKLNSYGGV